MTIGIFTGISIVIGIGTGRDVLEGGHTLQHGGRRPPKRFFRLGGRIMAAPTQKPRKKNGKKNNKFLIIK